jgi:hypothetical protein
MLYSPKSRKVRTKKEPKKPYTIKEAADYPGWLGVPKRVPGDAPPEVKTI